MVRNRYGKVEVTKTVTDGTNTFAEIKVTGGANEVVNVWLSTEEVSKLIWWCKRSGECVALNRRGLKVNLGTTKGIA